MTPIYWIKKVVIPLAVVAVGYTSFGFLFLDWSLHKDLELKDTPVVIEETKGIAQLMSAVYYSEVVIDSVHEIHKNKTNLMSSLKNMKTVKEDKVSYEQFVLIGNGHCYAGSDLSGLSKGNITIDKKANSIELRIPKAKIFNTIINPSDFEIFIDEGGFSFEEVRGIKQMAVDRIKELALKSGILEKADKKTVKSLTSLYKMFGFEKVNIVLQ